MTIYSHLPVLSEIEIESLTRVACRPGEPTTYRVEDIPGSHYPCVGTADRDFFRTHPKTLTFANGEVAVYCRDSFWALNPYYIYMGRKVPADQIRAILGTEQVQSYEVFGSNDLMYA